MESHFHLSRPCRSFSVWPTNCPKNDSTTLRARLRFLSHYEPPSVIVAPVARSLKCRPVYKMIVPTDQFESGFTKLSFHL